MAEISNNLIAGLLVLAIVISTFSVLTVVNIPVSLTGLAAEQSGLANLSITGQIDIKIHQGRNQTMFGPGTLGGANRIITTNQTNNPPTTFDDGSEGNGTRYGSCAQGDEDTCVYPFVIINDGNVDVMLEINASEEANSWIYTGAGAWFAGKANESDACEDWSGYVSGPWMDLNASSQTVCNNLSYLGPVTLGDPPSPTNKDELRIHFRLLVPGDAPTGGKNVTVTLGATAAT